MKFKKEHEPKLEDMDDYKKPLSGRKTRIILVSFLVVAVVWSILQ